MASAFFAFALLTATQQAHAQDLSPPSTGAVTESTTGTTTGGPTPGPPGSPPEAAKLDKEEKKDSKRGLEWVYLNADAGFSYIDMTGLSNSSLAVQQTSSAGPMFGLGAGIRLFILTLGARANMNMLSSFNLWQLDAELGIHIPIGHWDPYFGLHGGYCFVGSLDNGVSGSPSLSITGADAGAQLGVDYYFNHFVSLGLDLSGNLLFLHRPPTALPTGVASQLPANDQALYSQTGDSVGFGVAPSLHVGLHL